MAVATKIFWALGYNQVESFLTTFDPKRVEFDPKATIRRPSGARTRFTQDDINAILERVARNAGRDLSRHRRPADSRQDPGRLPCMTARVPTIPTTSSRTSTAASCARCASSARGRTSPISRPPNTLDTLVTENGRTVVKHYLQDVGSTFGMCNDLLRMGSQLGALLSRETPRRRRLFSFGFALSPWQTVDYVEYPSIGKFEGDRFDPRTWRPQTPTTAYLELRDDDAFWAARRVAAFTDDLIRAAVHTGEYSDPAAEKYLADVLIKRRDKITSTLSDRGEPDRRPASRCERPADVRKRGVRGWRGERPGHLPRLLVSLRQRDGRDASPGRHAEPDDHHRGAARACRRRPAASWRWISPWTARRTRHGGSRSARTSAASRGWTLVGSNACGEPHERCARVPRRAHCRRRGRRRGIGTLAWRAVTVVEVDRSGALQTFEEARMRVPSTTPLVETRCVRDVPAASNRDRARPRANLLHALAYYVDGQRLVRADVPLWFAKMKGPALRYAVETHA